MPITNSKKHFFKDYDVADRIWCSILIIGGAVVGAMVVMGIQAYTNPDILYFRYVIVGIITSSVLTAFFYHRQYLKDEKVGNDESNKRNGLSLFLIFGLVLKILIQHNGQSWGIDHFVN